MKNKQKKSCWEERAAPGYARILRAARAQRRAMRGERTR